MFTPDEVLLIHIVMGNRAQEVRTMLAEGRGNPTAKHEDERYASNLELVAKKADYLRLCPQR